MTARQNDDSPESLGFETAAPDRAAARAALRPRLKGTNIDESSFLATDYINHFNEVVMLIDMAGEMPELLEDAAAWRPKSYEDHFNESGFPHGALAIEAYRLAPERCRRRLDAITARLDEAIPAAIARMRAARGNVHALEAEREAALAEIRGLIAALGGVVHGRDEYSDQDEIDALFAN